ncbi:MAG: restriction endonuclease [Candidatus Bathyarchaeota archaeon]|nr:restriction endonuclease [Candidatus Termiticorpusculum sp.]
MSPAKLNGIIQEILEKPNINITLLLQNNLRLSPDKAEVLANRIEKQYIQTTNKTKQYPIKIATKKPAELKQQKQTRYNLEILSNKEFITFTFWLLQELGYNVNSEKFPTLFGVDYLATKNNSKTAFLARKYSSLYMVSDVVVLMAQQAKRIYQCDHVIVLTTAEFTDKAKIVAEKCSVELWDIQKLDEKIMEVKTDVETNVPTVFPNYMGNLLDSMLALEKHEKFLIEKRVGEKYDLFLLGIKFPLLTFQVQNNKVVKIICRVEYNEPVGENEGETLIKCDKNGVCSELDDEIYARVTEYLGQFLE